MIEEKTKKEKPAKLFIASNLLKATRFSLLPEAVQDLGKELINRAKAGEKVAVSNPHPAFFVEAK